MKKIAAIIDPRTIEVYDAQQFDWYAIRNSGQIFTDPPCTVTESDGKIVIKSTGDKDSKWFWNFFDLDTDYSEIKDELNKVAVLQPAIKAGQGVRILRQPFVQCLVSFIISANNNIKRFSKTIAQIDFGNLDKYTEDDFKRMGCGYRAPYLVKTVQQLKTMDSTLLGKLDNTALRKALMALMGVGRKVCDCVMLFAGVFHRLDTAPVDTWIKKAMEQLGSDVSVISDHKYAGVAQQYIFYYLQHLHKTL